MNLDGVCCDVTKTNTPIKDTPRITDRGLFTKMSAIRRVHALYMFVHKCVMPGGVSSMRVHGSYSVDNKIACARLEKVEYRVTIGLVEEIRENLCAARCIDNNQGGSDMIMCKR